MGWGDSCSGQRFCKPVKMETCTIQITKEMKVDGCCRGQQDKKGDILRVRDFGTRWKDSPP